MIYAVPRGRNMQGREKNMLLAIDIGNTNITIGMFEGERLVMESRLATDRKRTSDQYAIELMDILRAQRRADF